MKENVNENKELKETIFVNLEKVGEQSLVEVFEKTNNTINSAEKSVSDNNMVAVGKVEKYKGAESSDVERVKGVVDKTAKDIEDIKKETQKEIDGLTEKPKEIDTEKVAEMMINVQTNKNEGKVENKENDMEKMIADMGRNENGYLEKTKKLYTIDDTAMEKMKAQFDDLGKDKIDKDRNIIKKGKSPEERARIEKSVASLENRYNDERNNLENIKNGIENYVGEELVAQLGKDVEKLKDKKFDVESKKVVFEQTKKHIESLLGEKGKRHNLEKQKAVENMTENYLNLLLKAQEEGDISKDVSAEDIQKLAVENIWKLAFQDRVAAENTLGDHGIRHLVMHNIKMTNEVFDQLNNNGQKVNSIDRLMAHQIMIDHDIGYATEPAREAINAGFMSADRGHNVVAAKFIKQQAEDPNHHMSKVFNGDQLGTIHKGILEHDKSNIKLIETAKGLKEGTIDEDQARKDNLFDAISIADNSHAFEDKLPEILYSHPDSLEYMNLMKAAGEAGDKELVEKIKDKLKGSVQEIVESGKWSKDDGEALEHAVDFISADSYKFAVGRIAGNKPKIEIDKKGNLLIKVQESAVHQEAVQLFGQESYDQFHKFITDYVGKPENLDPPATEEEIQSATKDKKFDFKKVIRGRMDKGETTIAGHGMKIELAIGENKETEPDSDLEKNVRRLITKPEFMAYREEERILEESFKKAKKEGNEAEANLIQEKRLKLTKEYVEKL